MNMPVKLLFVFLIMNTVLKAQSGTSAKVSATIISPASVVGNYNTATLKKDNSYQVTATFFSQPSSKSAQRSSLRLPILKQKINFATIKLNNINTVVCISLPQTVFLKNSDASEAIIAYQFEHCVNLAPNNREANQVIQLSAFVATATDQEMGVYACAPIEVVVNYN